MGLRLSYTVKHATGKCLQMHLLPL
jgi:hypothetical protein